MWLQFVHAQCCIVFHCATLLPFVYAFHCVHSWIVSGLNLFWMVLLGTFWYMSSGKCVSSALCSWFVSPLFCQGPFSLSQWDRVTQSGRWVGKKENGILVAWLLAPTFLPTQPPSSTSSLTPGILTYPSHWLPSCWCTCCLGPQVLGWVQPCPFHQPASQSSWAPRESSESIPNLTDSSWACLCLHLMPWTFSIPGSCVPLALVPLANSSQPPLVAISVEFKDRKSRFELLQFWVLVVCPWQVI